MYQYEAFNFPLIFVFVMFKSKFISINKEGVEIYAKLIYMMINDPYLIQILAKEKITKFSNNFSNIFYKKFKLVQDK